MPESITIHLNPEVAHTLHAAVEAGEYNSADEILQEALENWTNQREFSEPDILTLRRLWDEGKNSGPAVAIDFDKVLEEARERVRMARSKQFAHAG